MINLIRILKTKLLSGWKTNHKNPFTIPKKNEEDLYFKIFNHNWDAIFLLEDGVFIECNPKTLELFGCQKHQMLGKTPMDFSPDLQPDGVNSIEKARTYIEATLNGMPQNFEWLHKRYDGTLFVAEVGLNKLEYKGKNYLQANFRDISQQKLDKQELLEQKEYFEILANSSMYATFVSVPDGSGRVTFANDQALKFFNIDIEDLDKVRLYEFFPDPESLNTYRTALLEKKSITNHELRIIANGKYHDVIASSTILNYKTEVRAMNVFIDITEWRETERAWRKSEEKYRYIVENSPIGIFNRQLQGAYTYANPVFLHDTKCETIAHLNERERSSINNLIKPEIIEEIEELLMRDKKITDYELEIDINESVKIWFSLTIKLVEEANEVIGFALNITERKKAEEALRASEKRFLEALEQLPIPIAIIENNNINYLNNKFIETYGYTKADIPTLNNWMEKAYPDKEYREIQTNQWLIDSEESLKNWLATPTRTLQVTCKNGTVKWVDLTNQFIDDAYVTVFNDITAQRLTQISLLENEKRFRLIAILSGHIVYQYSKLNEQLNWDGAIERLTGYTYGEYANFKMADWENHIHPDDREVVTSTFRDAMRHNKTFHVEYRYKNKMGNYIWIEEECFALTVVKGEVQTAIGVMKDITASKDLERKILNRVIEVEENERMHFSQELHDGLGPLLSAIKIYVQWLGKPNANIVPSEILKDVENLLDESQNTLRDISFKLSPHVLKNYGLKEAIKAYVDKIKSFTQIDFELDTELFTYRFNETEEAILYRIICECITNSLKHANASRIKIALCCWNNIFEIFYADNGKGFDVNEVLSQHKGIGLLNMQSRLKAINGQMQIASIINRGTTINFKIDGLCNK